MNNSYVTNISIILALSAIVMIGVLDDSGLTIKRNTEASGPAITKESYLYIWERQHDPATGDIPNNIRAMELEFVQNRWIEPYYKNRNSFLSNDVWQRRGPFEVGGRTRAVEIDIRNESVIIAGGVSSGMWKSTNNGSSWSKTSLPYQLHSVSCIAQDTRPGKEDNWYYGTGEYWGNSASIYGDGIFKSTDNGNSWNILPATSNNQVHTWDQPFDFCWSIVTNPAAPDTLDEVMVATASMGILKSIDGGLTWKTVLAGSAKALFTDIAVTSQGVYYATVSSDGQGKVQGIYRSEDGEKWLNITPPNFPKIYRRVVIGIAPSDESQVFFLGETPNYGKLTFNSTGDSLWHSLWKFQYQSSNGNVVIGQWDDRSENLPKPEPTRGQMNSQRGYNLVIKVKPDNPDVVFIGSVAMYRSESGFKNNDWAWIGGTCPDESCDYSFRYTNHHADVHDIFFSNTNPNILYTGSDGGIHKTLDNMSNSVEWLSLNNGYFTTQFYSVSIDKGTLGSREIIGGLQDNGTLLSRSTDMVNNEWSNPLRADGFCSQIPDGAAYYYASQNATWQPKIKIFRIVHNEQGQNTTSTRIDPIGGEDFIWNTPFILDPNNSERMYLAGGKMLWRNNDLSGIPFQESNDSTSINWDSLSNTRIDFINKAPLGERITAVSVSKKPENIVYYGTSSGRVFKIVDAHIGNPMPVNVTGQNMPNGYISSIAFDPDDANNVVVSLSNYNILSIFMTTDGGINWASVSGNLEERSNGGGAGPGVNWISILKVGKRKVYFAGTTAGLFSTTYPNGDATAWQMEGPESIGNMVVHSIDLRQEDGYVVIGTHGTGVFEGFYKNLPDPPSPVTLTEPKDGTMNVLNSVELKWTQSGNNGFFEVEIAKDPNFIEIVHTAYGITDTKYTWQNIEQGRKIFYWRVRNSGPGGISEFSEIWQFTTAVAAPMIVFPSSGSDQVMTYFTFKWESVEFADSYRLQVAKGYNIEPLLIDTIVKGTEFAVENFDKNKRYVWRIASIENEFQGLFGEIYHFFTRHPSDVSSSKPYLGINITIEPNPIKDLGHISIKSDYHFNGSLILFDINGKPILNFANLDINPGGISIPLYADKIPSGMYYLVLSTNNKRVYEKLYIVR